MIFFVFYFKRYLLFLSFCDLLFECLRKYAFLKEYHNKHAYRYSSVSNIENRAEKYKMFAAFKRHPFR